MSKTSWPADKVERKPVVDLLPYARNARTHSDEQVAQIAASIREWGWTTPVLVDEDGMIIAGHGRVMAAQKLGIGDVPVMTANGWTEAQKKAYILADNKLAENAGWDMEKLKVEMLDLQALEFDTPLIGFSEDELAGLLADKTEGLTDEDEAPDVPIKGVTEPGDVWLCGNHRVCCGDSTCSEDVGKLLGEVSPHLMVTDPPYGVDYDPNWRNGKLDETGKVRGKVGSGGRAVGKVENDDTADWTKSWSLFPGAVAYVWCAALHNDEVKRSLETVGFLARSMIIWNKGRIAISRGDYHWQHEPCWYAVKKSKTAQWQGDRKQSTVWDIDKPQKSETGHSTQKPVECMRRPIVNNSSPGQAVYDPFGGSGTTMIAAESEGRHCYMMEINPLYVDVIVQRWQEFTGEEARLDGAGDTYAEVKNHRHGGKTTGKGKVREKARKS